MSIANPHIALLILAAGKASRMGKLKQLLPWKNTTLLGKVISTAQSTGLPVHVVLGHQSDAILATLPKNVIPIFNPDYAQGMGSSLAAGIRFVMNSHTQYTGCMILLADQPLISEKHLQNMVAHFKESEKGIIVTEHDQIKGVPVLFHRDYFSELSQLKGEEGAKKIIFNHLEACHFIPLTGSYQDFDTMEAYTQFQKPNDK